MTTLTTKTFGKTAKKEVKAIAPQVVSFKKVGNHINLKDIAGYTIGYVVEGCHINPLARLRIF